MGSNDLAMVGLAVRAGKALFGSAACEKGLKSKCIRLMLLQNGLSASSERRFKELCARYGVRALTIEGEGRLGAAIGRPGIMVLGITDQRFADAIRNNIDGGSGKE